MTLRTLLRQLEKLDRLAGVNRTREARRLSDVAMAELAAAGDEGVYEATRTATYAEVAAELGVSIDAIRKAVRQHNRRKSAVRSE